MAKNKFLDLIGLTLFKSKIDAMLQAAITRATVGKQEKLKAGTGIIIYSDNTIAVTLDSNMFVVVSSLPEEPETKDYAKIHMVPNGDMFDEYVYNAYSTPHWQLIGSKDIGTVIADHYTKTEVDSMFARFKEPMTEEQFEAMQEAGQLEAGAYYPTYEE